MDGGDPYSDCPEAQGGTIKLSKPIKEGGHPNREINNHERLISKREINTQERD